MREEIVEGGADLQEALRRPFFDDLAGDLLDEGFPVGWGDVCLVCYFLAERALVGASDI